MPSHISDKFGIDAEHAIRVLSFETLNTNEAGPSVSIVLIFIDIHNVLQRQVDRLTRRARAGDNSNSLMFPVNPSTSYVINVLVSLVNLILADSVLLRLLRCMRPLAGNTRTRSAHDGEAARTVQEMLGRVKEEVCRTLKPFRAPLLEAEPSTWEGISRAESEREEGPLGRSKASESGSDSFVLHSTKRGQNGFHNIATEGHICFDLLDLTRHCNIISYFSFSCFLDVCNRCVVKA